MFQITHLSNVKIFINRYLIFFYLNVRILTFFYSVTPVYHDSSQLQAFKLYQRHFVASCNFTPTQHGKYHFQTKHSLNNYKAPKS
jgi:hypothetical protein